MPMGLVPESFLHRSPILDSNGLLSAQVTHEIREADVQELLGEWRHCLRPMALEPYHHKEACSRSHGSRRLKPLVALEVPTMHPNILWIFHDVSADQY